MSASRIECDNRVRRGMQLFKKAKVLIIEDEQDIARIVRDYLSVNNFEAIIAETGKEGIYC